MKPEIDEILLTAYALGELDALERARVAAFVESDADARQFVENIRETADNVTDVLAAESMSGLGAMCRERITQQSRIAIRPSAPTWQIRRWLPLAASIAASVLIVCGTVALLLPKYFRPAVTTSDDSDQRGILVLGPDGKAMGPGLPGDHESETFASTRTSLAALGDSSSGPVEGMVDPSTVERDNLAARPAQSVEPRPAEQKPVAKTTVAAGPVSSPDAEAVKAKPPVKHDTHGSISVSPPRDPKEFEKIRDAGLEIRPRIYENAFRLISQRTVSSFPVRVDSASYRTVRASLLERTRPAGDRVRIEELVNYFSYDYPTTAAPGPAVAASVEIVTCPWNVKNRLARIAIKARDGDAKVVARAVEVSVEFNPLTTSASRLIGYENAPKSGKSRLTHSATLDLPAGAAATAFYEIVPTHADLHAIAGKDLFNLIVSWADPADAAPYKLTVAATDAGQGFDRATDDFRFASAVAAFGMLLRDSQFKGTATFADVIRWATPAKSSDESPERAEFIDLARRARDLSR